LHGQAVAKAAINSGVAPRTATHAILRTNSTAIAAVAVLRGDAGSMICGPFGEYWLLLRQVTDILSSETVHPADAM